MRVYCSFGISPNYSWPVDLEIDKTTDAEVILNGLVTHDINLGSENSSSRWQDLYRIIKQTPTEILVDVLWCNDTLSITF